jgi:hypothetical protein
MKHILLLALSLALLIAGCAAFLAAFAEGGETRFYSPSGDYIGRAEPQQTGEVRFTMAQATTPAAPSLPQPAGRATTIGRGTTTGAASPARCSGPRRAGSSRSDEAQVQAPARGLGQARRASTRSGP